MVAFIIAINDMLQNPQGKALVFSILFLVVIVIIILTLLAIQTRRWLVKIYAHNTNMGALTNIKTSWRSTTIEVVFPPTPPSKCCCACRGEKPSKKRHHEEGAKEI
jgi:hypothetical protein